VSSDPLTKSIFKIVSVFVFGSLKEKTYCYLLRCFGRDEKGKNRFKSYQQEQDDLL